MRRHICKNFILQEQRKYIPKMRQLGLVAWDGDACKLKVEERMIREETCCRFPREMPDNRVPRSCRAVCPYYIMQVSAFRRHSWFCVHYSLHIQGL
jgi:hypothetical protein